MSFTKVSRSALVWASLVMGAFSQSTATVTSAPAWGGGGGGGPPASLYPCFSQFMAMQAGLPNDTSNAAELCAVSGSLWNAMSTAQACIGQTVQNIPVPVAFTRLNAALATCNSLVTSSFQSSCSSLSAKRESCTVSSSIFAQIVIAAATASTNTIPATNTAAQTGGEQPSSTSSADPSRGKSGSNIGLVAGVAVGAALGALIIVCTAAFFIWRWRRQTKARETRGASTELGEDTEKAQLPGDESRFGFFGGRKELNADASSERKELASPPPGYARNVGTLQEMDGSTTKLNRNSCIKELASNEEVATEMATTEHSGDTTDISKATTEYSNSIKDASPKV